VELFADAGLPPGVVGVVQGSKEVSERLIANPHVEAVSFVGSSAVAESVSFRERIQVGMLGINLGLPAPMAFFPFGGWKSSLYGDLFAQGGDAVAFYTRKKVITERWFGAERPRDGWV
jgi:malonate-semialdehyde dehydrogenase (acetylating) / methylmalonate-semialdehyde dehydrogenase